MLRSFFNDLWYYITLPFVWVFGWIKKLFVGIWWLIKYPLLAFVILLVGSILVEISLPEYMYKHVKIDHVGVCVNRYDWMIDNYYLGYWRKGLVPRNYGPGYYFLPNFLYRFETLDFTIQKHIRTDDPKVGDKLRPDPIIIKTNHGLDIRVDITFDYKVKNAYSLVKEFKTFDMINSIVRKISEDIAKNVLGTLSAEDFYNAPVLDKKSIEFEETLKEKLAELDLELIAVLVRHFHFPEHYQIQLNNKVLQGQLAEINTAREQVEEFKGQTQAIEADTKAKVAAISGDKEKQKKQLTAQNKLTIAEVLARANKYKIETMSGADRYLAEQTAAGQQLVLEAEAEKIRLKNQAIAAEGGEHLVGYEAAESVEGVIDITINTLENDLMNPETMRQTLSGTK